MYDLPQETDRCDDGTHYTHTYHFCRRAAAFDITLWGMPRCCSGSRYISPETHATQFEH